jgi:hypothetical protein
VARSVNGSVDEMNGNIKALMKTINMLCEQVNTLTRSQNISNKRIAQMGGELKELR